ncbi:hypothetical protein CFP56_006793 [Quercus suber]|uniref:Mannan endo-1,4-beta-mannosidase n=1 Tax=Quercus suber TaxID=58331 RepID=A0AAW0M984_QUESU
MGRFQYKGYCAVIDFLAKRYDAMRKYTASAYMILSNQLGNSYPKEQLLFAGNFNHVVIDMHYYNLYSNEISNMNVQSYALKTVTTSNGPLIVVNQILCSSGSHCCCLV